MKKSDLLSIVLVLIGLNSFAAWPWQNPMPRADNLSSVYFTDACTAYMVGENGTIFKTDNAGLTWIAVMKMETPVASPINLTHIKTDYTLVDDGTIYQTSEKKPTWYSWLKNLEMKIALFIYLF